MIGVKETKKKKKKKRITSIEVVELIEEATVAIEEKRSFGGSPIHERTLSLFLSLA